MTTISSWLWSCGAGQPISGSEPVRRRTPRAVVHLRTYCVRWCCCRRWRTVGFLLFVQWFRTFRWRIINFKFYSYLTDLYRAVILLVALVSGLPTGFAFSRLVQVWYLSWNIVYSGTVRPLCVFVKNSSKSVNHVKIVS